MYAFYPSTVLIGLLHLSAVSATPTPATSGIPSVQKCTTSWNPGESNPQGITGYCELEGVNCNTGLSVMPTAELGEITCTPQNGIPTPCCFPQVKCGNLDQGHCQNREKTCVNGGYSVAAGNLDISCPGGGYCCEPQHTDDFLGLGLGGRGSGRRVEPNPFSIFEQPGAGSVAGSKDLELDTPGLGVDLDAFKTNYITGKAPYGTDSITPFTDDTSQEAPKVGWDQ